MAVDNSKPAFIYCITNLVDDKKYVGKTNTPHRRWVNHCCDYNKVGGAQYEKLLYRAMRKHGIENFTYVMLQKYGSSEEALNDEDRWIDKLQSRKTQHGYNCAPGGKGPDKGGHKRRPRKPVPHTEASRSKMSQSMIEVHRQERLMFLPILKDLHNQGLSNKQIQDETALCAVTVRKWLKDLGLQSNALKRTPEQATPEIIALSRSGKTAKEISLIAKCKPGTVRKILIAVGIPVNRHRMGPAKGRIDEEFEAKKQAAIPVIIELRGQGMSVKKIRSQVKMGTKIVSDTIKRLAPKTL